MDVWAYLCLRFVTPEKINDLIHCKGLLKLRPVELGQWVISIHVFIVDNDSGEAGGVTQEVHEPFPFFNNGPFRRGGSVFLGVRDS